MDIAQLTQFLLPFLPYLLKIGEKAAEEAGEKLGEAAWEGAKALWVKLRPRVEAFYARMSLGGSDNEHLSPSLWS